MLEKDNAAFFIDNNCYASHLCCSSQASLDKRCMCKVNYPACSECNMDASSLFARAVLEFTVLCRKRMITIATSSVMQAPAQQIAYMSMQPYLF